jgi:hypothetical protein
LTARIRSSMISAVDRKKTSPLDTTIDDYQAGGAAG